MKKLLTSLFLAWTAVAQADMPRMDLYAGMYRIDAEVAADQQNRMVGLMNRNVMATHQGMLFVFPQSGVQCFWMKNTVLPLTAAFVAADGTIVNLADMQPMSEQSHCSARAVPYVLEMRQGWFKRNRILPGMKIRDVQNRYFQSQ